MGLFDKVAAAAVGPLIGGAFSAYGQSQANEATQASTQQQMDFQREMRGTSYQAAMKDMRKAGLNPMLAYQQGGAGALSGSSYTAQNELAGLGAGVTEGTSSAMAMRRQNADIDQINSNIKALDATALKTRQDTKTSSAQQRYLDKGSTLRDAETNLTDMMGAIARIDNQLKKYGLNSARAAATQAETDQQINQSKAGKVLRWIDRAGQSINPFASATKAVR